MDAADGNQLDPSQRHAQKTEQDSDVAHAFRADSLTEEAPLWQAAHKGQSRLNRIFFF
jgi:hypothetical protein